MRSLRSPIIALLPCCILWMQQASSETAAVWRVNAANCPVSSEQDGLTWETAFCEIQPAIDMAYTAGGGGEVWVVEGLYPARHGVSDRLRLHAGIALFGGFDGTEVARDTTRRVVFETTVIDGSIAPPGVSASRVGIVMDDNTQIEGIRFRGTIGSAISILGKHHTIIRQCIFSQHGIQNESGAIGIGIQAHATNVEITDCEFNANRQAYSAQSDKFSSGINIINARNIVLKNCIFADNRETAIYISGVTSDISILDSSFSRNEAKFGGAIELVQAKGVRIDGCLFENNRALGGGAISIEMPPRLQLTAEELPRITNCIFWGNQSVDNFPSGPSTGAGGAIYATNLLSEDIEGEETPEGDLPEGEGCKGSEGEVEGHCRKGAGAQSPAPKCVFGVACPAEPYQTYYNPFIIVNSVFVGNTSGFGGAIASSPVWPLILNSIFWASSSPLIAPFDRLPYDPLDYPNFSHSILEECPDGIDPTNLCGDPLFVDAENGDFRLRWDSPAIDAGRDVSNPVYGSVTTDIEGTPRGVPGTTAPRGDGSRYDIGAFEFIPVHSADLDGDGALGLGELLRVIQFFNSPAYHCAEPGSTEDGYAPGANPAAHACPPHTADYNPQDWRITLTEVLRAIQFYNSPGLAPCPTGEDGFCPL